MVTDNPEYFKVFANEALRRGYEIHVISGGPKATIEKFLWQWGIKYIPLIAKHNIDNLISKSKTQYRNQTSEYNKDSNHFLVSLIDFKSIILIFR